MRIVGLKQRLLIQRKMMTLIRRRMVTRLTMMRRKRILESSDAARRKASTLARVGRSQDLQEGLSRRLRQEMRMKKGKAEELHRHQVEDVFGLRGPHPVDTVNTPQLPPDTTEGHQHVEGQDLQLDVTAVGPHLIFVTDPDPWKDTALKQGCHLLHVGPRPGTQHLQGTREVTTPPSREFGVEITMRKDSV